MLRGLPASDPGAPAVLVLPGGGYQLHADHEAEPVAEWFHQRGFAAFVLRYRVAPHRFPAGLLDAWRTLRWLRRHAGQLGFRPDRVVVLGFSAGGHVAALLAVGFDPEAAVAESASLGGTTDDRPDGCVLGYPATRVSDPVTAELLGDNLFGEPRSAKLRKLDVADLVDAATPPTFIWHTAPDRVVPAAQSLDYTNALVRAGVPVELHLFDDGPHGIGLAAAQPGARQWPALVDSWLDVHGFVPASH